MFGLKKNSDFVAVYHSGKSYANRYLIMYALKNGTDSVRIGVSVSKRVGNSVVRHRVKRLIKESCRLHDVWFKQGYDVVIIARKAAAGRSYDEIESAVLHLMGLHHIRISQEEDKAKTAKGLSQGVDR